MSSPGAGVLFTRLPENTLESVEQTPLESVEQTQEFLEQTLESSENIPSPTKESSMLMNNNQESGEKTVDSGEQTVESQPKGWPCC